MLLKADKPISFKPSLSFTALRFLHSANAEYSIVSTVLGISTDFKFMFSEKAFSPILITFLESIAAGIFKSVSLPE